MRRNVLQRRRRERHRACMRHAGGRHFPEDCTSLLDSVLHVSGVLERRQVGVEAACVAILAGYKPVKRDVIPTIAFANRSSAPILSIRPFRLSPRQGADESFSCSSAA